MARTANRFNALEDKKQPAAPTATGKTYRVALYARLSVDRDGRKGESIENQLDIMKGYIKSHPELSNYREYIDKGFTGTNFDRPEFNRMMNDVREGRINCLLLKDLSRFGRDYLETTNYIEVILPFLGVRLISVNDHFDTDERNNANKELEITLKNLANDMYAKDISKKIVSSKQQNMDKGKFLGGTAPYGYMIDRSNPLGRYVIDEKPAGIVREIFRLASGDKGLIEISSIMESKGINSPGVYKKTGHFYHEEGDPDVKWLSSTIARILSNEAYIGNLVRGKSRSRLYDNEKRHNLSRDEWQVIENAHEVIVSRELFEAVHERLAERAKKSRFAGRNHPENAKIINRYKGIIFCGSCGRGLSLCHSWRERKDGLKRYSSFICSNDEMHREGKRGTILESKLDRIVCDAVRDELQELTEKKVTADAMEKVLKIEIKSMEAETQKIKNRIARTEYEEFECYQDYALGKVSKDEYIERRNTYENRLVDYRIQMSEEEERIRRKKAGMEKRIRSIRGLYRANGKRVLDEDLLHLLVDRIEIANGNVDIRWAFKGEDMG